MNELQVFNNNEFQIRTLLIGDEPWFVGKEVATLLGYKNGTRDVNRHVEKEDRRYYQIGTPSGKQTSTIINESGLYSLILGSKLESAKRFKRWVTSEVLPQIRKQGSYSLPKVSYAESLRLLADSIEENEKLKLENKIQEQQINENVLKLNIPTWNDLFLAVFDEQWKNKAYRTQQSYKTANNLWKELHNVAINKITLKMLEEVFNRYKFENLSSQSKQSNLKIVATSIFNYAIKHDYIEKNYASFLKVEDMRRSKKLKEAFTKEDIQKFVNDDTMLSKCMLIMCYTGLRPSELLEINKENIDFEKRIMIGGKKTKNGINRHIPIHASIVEYLKEFINSKYYHAEYSKVRKEFVELQEKLSIKHNTYMHSGRHTFASISVESGIKDIVIKKIMGHSTNDLTKDVYTHISDEILLEEIKKIPTLF